MLEIPAIREPAERTEEEDASGDGDGDGADAALGEEDAVLGAEGLADRHGALVSEFRGIGEGFGGVAAVEGDIAVADVDVTGSEKFGLACGALLEDGGVRAASGVGTLVDDLAGDLVEGAGTHDLAVVAVDGLELVEVVEVERLDGRYRGADGVVRADAVDGHERAAGADAAGALGAAREQLP